MVTGPPDKDKVSHVGKEQRNRHFIGGGVRRSENLCHGLVLTGFRSQWHRKNGHHFESIAAIGVLRINKIHSLVSIPSSQFQKTFKIEVTEHSQVPNGADERNSREGNTNSTFD